MGESGYTHTLEREKKGEIINASNFQTYGEERKE